MNSTPETVAEILAEMRDGISTGRADVIDLVNYHLRVFADRIEAEEREREQATAEIIVQPSPSADTRSADHIITESELRASTEMHIGDVRRGMEWIARRLCETGARHDWTKLDYFAEFYRQFSEAQRTGDWGTGWYDEIHVVLERHHLNEKCPDDVTLLYVLEMIVDGVCAGMARSGTYYPGRLATAILERAFDNTQKLVADAVRVKAE